MRKTFTAILLMFLWRAAMSQVVQGPDDRPAREKALEQYLEAKGENLPLYNGIQHVGYPAFMKGSPYYKSDAWEEGSVFYDGILYKKVLLKYDMLKDEVIIRQPDTFLGIILFSPRVASFSFLHSSFVYKAKDSAASLPEGFYEQLVKGKISLWARRKQIIEEKIIYSELVREFIRQDQYYMILDGKYHLVKNAKTALNLLGEKKKNIQRYLRKNKIRFKKDPEYTLLKMAEQYNQTND